MGIYRNIRHPFQDSLIHRSFFCFYETQNFSIAIHNSAIEQKKQQSDENKSQFHKLSLKKLSFVVCFGQKSNEPEKRCGHDFFQNHRIDENPDL